ncbi:MAG TPA: serine hydrolase [Rhizomicrobium sp.]|jgi:CubicO group peptidase (beta-lactamase class C family)|nr:serine hydrolase [Rhizomicrobium sp.]
MHKWIGATAAFMSLTAAPVFGADYFPPKGDGWSTHTPQQEKFDPVKLKQAVDFAISAERTYSPELAKVADIRDLRIAVPLEYGHEAFNTPIGPLKPHAPANGVILRHGHIVAEWGKTRDVDMTFSVSKTFLSSVAGVAFDKGLIKNVNDRVIDYVQPTPDFMLPHNQPISWDNMLRQDSGWIGTMWGKPWWADRPGKDAWSELAKGPPPVGQEWKYNDVRVNALALALTYLWKRPLPDVLKEYVADPIGMSDSWHWEGYDNSWVTIDGKQIHVVSGGGHWGGGMFISARDEARLGLLGLNNGKWDGKQILSDQWVTMAKTPTVPNPGYGFCNWYLNTNKAMYPDARADSVTFIGDGANEIFIDYQHGIVAVVRWIDGGKMKDFVRLLVAATNEPAP